VEISCMALLTLRKRSSFELCLWLLSRRGYLAHSLQDIPTIPVLNGRSKCSKPTLMTLPSYLNPTVLPPYLHRIEATPTIITQPAFPRLRSPTSEAVSLYLLFPPGKSS